MKSQQPSIATPNFNSQTIIQLSCRPNLEIDNDQTLALWWRDDNVKLVDTSKRHIRVAILDDEGRENWLLIGFYGEPNRARRSESWQALRTLLSQGGRPLVVLGDFNEILFSNEKEGGQHKSEADMQEFRNVIDEYDLLDLGCSGIWFTWQRRCIGGIVRERLDRALGTLSWCEKFERKSVTTLARYCSDHCPIVLWAEEKSTPATAKGGRAFKFESLWLENRKCEEMVRRGWNKSQGPIWEKIANCSDTLDQWARKEYGSRKQRIKKLERTLESLQSRPVDGVSLERIGKIVTELDSLHKDEEAYWFMRSRSKELRDGDRNTSYFHRKACARRARNRIDGLLNDNGDWIQGKEEIENLITGFYGKLFTAEGCSRIEEALSGIQRKLGNAERRMLDREPDDEEIRAALMQMHPTKAPGPDGLHAIFYQKYWAVVGSSVCEFVKSWWRGETDIREVNKTSIALIPKVKKPMCVKEFRPISLCNVIYKIVSKLMANRMKSYLPKLVSVNQSAFVSGRLITDNAMVAAEIFHYMKHKKKGRNGEMALKLDMEKAYDRVEWEFLDKCLAQFGFPIWWRERLMNCVSTTAFNFKINGAICGELYPTRGLRQGDPISPYLFILCVEALSGLLSVAARDQVIHGTKICRRAPSVSHLLFADDSVVFTRATKEESQSLLAMLSSYEEASGQRVNKGKSEVFFSTNVGVNKKNELVQILGMREAGAVEKYLGFPMMLGRSKKAVFAACKERIWSKLRTWKEKLLSAAGREVLIKSVAQAIPAYLMCLYQLPKTILEEIRSIISRFWWGSRGEERKIHWVNWDTLVLPKDMGGLGFRDLEIFNTAMLAKQGWRLLNGTSPLAGQVFKARYFPKSDFLSSYLGHQPSPVWRSIWGAKALLKEGLGWRIGDGLRVNASHDAWVPEGYIMRPPVMLNGIGECGKVADFINQDTRTWERSKLEQVFAKEDVRAVLSLPLSRSNICDSHRWWPDHKGEFSVRSAYRLGLIGKELWDVTRGEGNGPNIWKSIWKLSGPPKLRHFAWRMRKGALAVKSELYRRGITANQLCTRCNEETESLDHALFHCSTAKQIWAGEELCNLEGFGCWGTMDRFIDNVRGTKGVQGVQRFFVLAWTAWLFRNKMVHGETGVKPATLKESMVRWVSEAVEQRTVWLSDRRTQPMQGEQRRWVPPKPGCMKVNTDAMVLRDHIGLGVVVRDEHGNLRAVATAKVSAGWSVLLAETEAVLFGMDVACALGYSNLEVETDALEAVKLYTDAREYRNYAEVVAEDIRRLSSSCSSFSLTHIPRDCNTVAHLAARLSCEPESERIWTCNFPPGVACLANFDAMN